MLPLVTIEEELRRCPQLRPEYIEMIREWLKRQPHLPQIDDDFTIAMFLRSCEYSIERTKITIDNYYTFKTHVPEMLVGRDTNKRDIQQCFDLLQIVILEDTDADGNLVMLERLRHSDPSTYDGAVAMKTNLMMVEGWVRTHGTAPGVILVFDQTGFGLGHLARLPALVAKKMLHFVQLRIHTEGSFEEFYKFVPKEILPREYGGAKSDMDTLHEKAKKEAESYNSLFQKLDHLVVDESKRVGKAANADTFFGVEGSFRKLDID